MSPWRTFVTVSVLAGLWACQAMPPSGDPLAPVKVKTAVPPAPVPEARPGDAATAGGATGDAASGAAGPSAATGAAKAPGAAGSGFDFEGEDRKADEETPEVELDAVALQAKYLGVDPALLGGGQAAAPAPVAAMPGAPVMPEIGAWDPSRPLPQGGFGVQLLATMHDMQPPMAVLGLPDGTKQVVQAGDILAAHRLVVMAVGRDLIQVARFTPQGFYARVDTENLQSLFPQQRQAALP